MGALRGSGYGVPQCLLVPWFHRLGYWLPPGPAVTASITLSRLKLPGFWRRGKSLKLCTHFAT